MVWGANMTIPRAFFVILATLTLTSSASVAATFVYVSLDGENRIVIYQANEAGELTHIGDSKLDHAPGSLAISPSGDYLFAALRTAGYVASFRIDQSSGQLSPINQVGKGKDTAFVATDRTGRYLLAADYIVGFVAVYRIGADGTLSEMPADERTTDIRAHAILTDPSNRFALVPHTAPNSIHQFKFDDQTGKLTPNQPPVVKTAPDTGPRQLAFHPNGRVAYFDYEQGSAVAAFDFDPSRGTLTFRERLPTIPAGTKQENTNARLEMTRDGRFLYVANRGHHSLAGFQVDDNTGKLHPLGHTATEAVPRGFGIDPTGKFLYAAGEATGKLAAFRIGARGHLKRLGTYPVGERPWWVLVTRYD